MKMMKYLICLSLTFLFFACHKAEDDVIEGKYGTLKNIQVAGATKVAFDKQAGIIQVTLPESYTKEFVYLDLDLYEGAKLELHPWDRLNSPTRAGFYFRGSPPFYFTVTRGDELGSGAKTYIVYVEHLGPLHASLASEILLEPTRSEPYSYFHTFVDFESGVGTIPERPDNTKVVVPKILDSENKNVILGKYDDGIKQLVFFNKTALSLDSYYSLELEYGEKKFTFPNKRKLKRSAITSYLSDFNEMFQMVPKNKQVLLEGGYYLPDKNYTIKIENAFSNDVSLQAEYKNPSLLSFTVPEAIADGGYLASLYEEELLVKSFVFNITDDTDLKGIRKIATESLDCPSSALWYSTPRNLAFQKGQSMYVAPFPAISASYLAVFDEKKKLPDLELKNSRGRITLKAKTRADRCYADGTVLLYYGEYTIPANMAPGSYEARLVYPEGVNSMPFWTLININ